MQTGSASLHLSPVGETGSAAEGPGEGNCGER